MEVLAQKTSVSTRLRLRTRRVSVVRPLPQEACSPKQATCSRFTANHGRIAHDPHIFPNRICSTAFARRRTALSHERGSVVFAIESASDELAIVRRPFRCR